MMFPSKKEFRETILKLQADKRMKKDREYLAYVRGAVDRMEPRKINWKMRGYNMN